jgi:hypothetical protein
MGSDLGITAGDLKTDWKKVLDWWKTDGAKLFVELLLPRWGPARPEGPAPPPPLPNHGVASQNLDLLIPADAWPTLAARPLLPQSTSLDGWGGLLNSPSPVPRRKKLFKKKRRSPIGSSPSRPDPNVSPALLPLDDSGSHVARSPLSPFSSAEISYTADYRYPLFWQGLESLFGADDESPGISKRLRDRISFFLADTAASQQKLHDTVRTCYKTRSEIVHGRWEEGPEIDDRMGDTESVVRTVVRHIMDKPGMLGAFLSPKRDEWLEAWVQSKAFVPPPFPK